MTELVDALRAGGDSDVIRKGVELVLQTLIEAEATKVVGGDRYECRNCRTTQRHGVSSSRGLSASSESPYHRRSTVQRRGHSDLAMRPSPRRFPVKLLLPPMNIPVISTRRTTRGFGDDHTRSRKEHAPPWRKFGSSPGFRGH